MTSSHCRPMRSRPVAIELAVEAGPVLEFDSGNHQRDSVDWLAAQMDHTASGLPQKNLHPCLTGHTCQTGCSLVQFDQAGQVGLQEGLMGSPVQAIAVEAQLEDRVDLLASSAAVLEWEPPGVEGGAKLEAEQEGSVAAAEVWSLLPPGPHPHRVHSLHSSPNCQTAPLPCRLHVFRALPQLPVVPEDGAGSSQIVLERL
jgi:hypothetical protein